MNACAVRYILGNLSFFKFRTFKSNIVGTVTKSVRLSDGHRLLDDNTGYEMKDSVVFCNLSGRKLGRTTNGFKTTRGIILTAC